MHFQVVFIYLTGVYISPVVLPHITRHPENTTVMVNSPFTLYCEVTFGLGNITYQWRKDNKELSNGNSMNYSVNSANIRDTGIYWCTVTNHRGEVATSQPAIVTIQGMDKNLFVVALGLFV